MKKSILVKKSKNEELAAIVRDLDPYEQAWCVSLQAEIMMFLSGYSVNLYDVGAGEFVSGYFVPDKMVDIRKFSGESND